MLNTLENPKVLLVAEGNSSGGVGRYCVDLAGALGNDAALACLCPQICDRSEGCWLERQCKENGLVLQCIFMAPKGWRDGLRGLRRLWEQMGRPLLHVNGRRGNLLALALKATVSQASYVTTVHGVLGLHDKRNALYRLVDVAGCHGADGVIAVSTDTKRRLIRQGVARHSVFHVPNGLADRDLERLGGLARSRMSSPRGRAFLRIGYYGRMSPEKGALDLAELALEVYGAEPRARFVVAGSGPSLQELLGESRALLEDGILTYVGEVENAADFLSQVDVIILPSRNEGLPYVLLEGMAAGCAVVAYGVGGIPEVVTHSQLGVLVRPGDVSAFAAALIGLARAPERAREVGARASVHVHERFRLESRLSLLNEIYAMCRVGSEGARPPRPL
ncbi:MAG: glycosyltransferase family 4 protein [Armatimonadetes bacterium]|nr:glycosyltransferase family 4 protein [Armatimonadota bacterium]